MPLSILCSLTMPVRPGRKLAGCPAPTRPPWMCLGGAPALGSHPPGWPPLSLITHDTRPSVASAQCLPGLALVYGDGGLFGSLPGPCARAVPAPAEDEWQHPGSTRWVRKRMGEQTRGLPSAGWVFMANGRGSNDTLPGKTHRKRREAWRTGTRCFGGISRTEVAHGQASTVCPHGA